MECRCIKVVENGTGELRYIIKDVEGNEYNKNKKELIEMITSSNAYLVRNVLVVSDDVCVLDYDKFVITRGLINIINCDRKLVFKSVKSIDNMESRIAKLKFVKGETNINAKSISKYCKALYYGDIVEVLCVGKVMLTNDEPNGVGIFERARFKEISLRGVDLSYMTNAHEMFRSCRVDKIDFSGCIMNNTKLRSTDKMFYTSHIKEIDISDLDMTHVCDRKNMFYMCEAKCIYVSRNTLEMLGRNDYAFHKCNAYIVENRK